MKGDVKNAAMVGSNNYNGRTFYSRINFGLFTFSWQLAAQLSLVTPFRRLS